MNLKGFELIGKASVDSGQLIVSDPCYIEKGLNYEDTCKVSLNGGGQVVNGLAVSFLTGYGDGVYEIYAKKDKSGRIVGIYIDLSLF